MQKVPNDGNFVVGNNQLKARPGRVVSVVPVELGPFSSKLQWVWRWVLPQHKIRFRFKTRKKGISSVEESGEKNFSWKDFKWPFSHRSDSKSDPPPIRSFLQRYNVPLNYASSSHQIGFKTSLDVSSPQPYTTPLVLWPAVKGLIPTAILLMTTWIHIWHHFSFTIRIQLNGVWTLETRVLPPPIPPIKCVIIVTFLPKLFTYEAPQKNNFQEKHRYQICP